MTKAILFDCFGVIYVGMRSYALSVCPEESRQELEDLFVQADYGFVSGLEFNVEAAGLLNLTEQQFIELCQERFHKDPAVIGLIRKLKTNYKVSLLTNANSTIIDQLFSEDEQAELFDDVLVSSSVGMIKPQVEFFELAASRIDCLPEECVMVDDLADNIAGAKATGMHGVVFSDAGQCQSDLERLGVHA